MSRGGIQIEVFLLNVLTMIAFVTVDAEQPFFQNRIASIPERQRETQAALTVGDTQQTVLPQRYARLRA